MLADAGAVALLGPAVQTTRRQLGEISKHERKVLDSDKTDGEKYSLLLTAQARKRKVLQNFTVTYDKAVAKTAGLEGAP